MTTRLSACLLAGTVMLALHAAPAAAAEPYRYEAGVTARVNDVRTHDVRWGPCVDRIAERRARHLSRTGTLEHSDLGPILDRCRGVLVGEVLARGALPPRAVVRAWLGSPPHRTVVTRERYRRVGVGAVRRDGTWTVVAIFIRH